VEQDDRRAYTVNFMMDIEAGDDCHRRYSKFGNFMNWLQLIGGKRLEEGEIEIDEQKLVQHRIMSLT